MSNFIRSFFRDSIIYLIPSIISRGLSLFLIPLYTLVLIPSDYGVLDLLLAFGSLINVIVGFEVSQGVARYYPESEDREEKILYASSAFWFTVICYSVFLVASLGTSTSMTVWILGKREYVLVFRLGMVYLWLNGLFYLIQNQFRWELRSKEYAWVSLIVSIGTASFSVWLVYLLRWGLTGTLYGMIFGTSAGCLYGIWKLRNSFRFRFHKAHLQRMLHFSVPLVPAGLAAFVSAYIDRVMIKQYLSLTEVGLYGVAFRLASVINLVMIGFQSALTPLIYTYHKEEKTPGQLAMIFRVFMLVSLTVFLGMSLFAKEIIMLITSEQYYESYKIVKYLVPSILLLSMYIFAPGIGIAKKSKYILWISILGALVNTLLNIVLIPLLGTIGAALATLIASLMVFVVYMTISQKLYYAPHQWKKLIACTGVAILLVVLGIYFNHETTKDIVIKSFLLLLGMITFIFSLATRNEIKTALVNWFFFKEKK